MQLFQGPERRLYREHKYITFVMNELDNKIGKADFRDAEQTKKIMDDLSSVVNLLFFHAKHEDEKIHVLLKKHNSVIFKETESDHRNHEIVFNSLKEQLSNLSHAKSDKEKIDCGYHFHLSYRKFIAENLEHINREETLLMPELSRLCTKEDLESIDYPVYQIMTSEELIGMLKALFPVLNPDDKEYFICDLVDAVPNQVIENWSRIAELFTAVEIADLASKIELIQRMVGNPRSILKCGIS